VTFNTLLKTGILCNDTTLAERIDEIPFQSEHQHMATLNKEHNHEQSNEQSNEQTPTAKKHTQATCLDHKDIEEGL